MCYQIAALGKPRVTSPWKPKAIEILQFIDSVQFPNQHMFDQCICRPSVYMYTSNSNLSYCQSFASGVLIVCYLQMFKQIMKCVRFNIFAKLLNT